MSQTLVIQSHRSPLPYPWIEQCLSSVRQWCDLNQYEYRFLGDELFKALPPEVQAVTSDKPVIASDLARLYAIQNALYDGHDRVIWLDADLLIFHQERFILSDSTYSVGREIWVQKTDAGRLKIYKKVHNAFLMFHKGNSFLDFYIETAERLLLSNTGGIPAQFIGPKLLTALHNIAVLPVMELAGMLSPLVIHDIVNNGGPALDLFRQNSSQPIYGANLCISSCERSEVSNEMMSQLIDSLLDKGLPG